MPVKVKCPSCEKVLNAPDKARGKAVKCPNCKNPVRIPAAKKQKPAAEAGAFDDDFLSGLDLGKVEDHTARVCPRCGAQAAEDDVECPACGADLATGQRASKKVKGKVNKKKYFQSAWSDAWSFLMKHKGYAIKSSVISLIFTLLTLGCGFMSLWSSGMPPKVFWGIMTAVMFLAPIGWPWFLTMDVIKLTLKGQNKVKHLTFGMFDGVALGIKFFVWTIVFGAPILAIFGGAAFLIFKSGNQIVAGILGGVGVLLVWSMLPVAMAHMAMPITTPGWMINRVLPGWAKSFGACFYAGFLIFIVALPVVGCLGGAGAAYGNRLGQVVRDLNYNSQVGRGEEEDSSDDALPGQSSKPALRKIQWNNTTVPLILFGVACLFSGPPIVFGARAVAYAVASYKPVLDLNPLEKQVKYVKKKEKVDEAGNPVDTSKTPTWLKWTAGTTGTIIFYVVVNIITYNFFDHLLILPRPIARLLRLVSD